MRTLIEAGVKDGTRLLCGRENCGQELASILRDVGELHLGPAWKQDIAGVWVLPKHARENVHKRGIPIQYRRKAPVVEGASGGIHGQVGRFFTKEQLPLEIKCWQCHGINTVPPELFD